MNDIPDLIVVAKNGNLQEVEKLLRQNYSVHIRGKDNETALYWSSCRGHVQICKVLIEGGSDVNARVTWGSTALHAATDRGHIHCVELLIRSGANINIQNKRGDTALHVGAYRGYQEIVKLITNAGANLFIKNDKGRTAADEAEGNSHRHTSNFLYQRMFRYHPNHLGNSSVTPPAKYKLNISNDQGQGYSSFGGFPNQVQDQLQNQGQRTGLTEQNRNLTDVFHSEQDSACYSFPEISSDRKKISDSNFLRYRDDLNGFRRKSEPEEMDEETVQRNDKSANKENHRTKLCRRESVNGSQENVFPELPDMQMRHKESKVAEEGVDNTNSFNVNVLSEFQPCNPPLFSENVNGGLLSLGSCGDIRMPNECLTTSVRPSRISVGCVREVMGSQQYESIEKFSEKLQLELFKTREKLEEKERENEKLQQQLNIMKGHLQQYVSACHLLKRENMTLRLQKTSQDKHVTKTQHATSYLPLHGFTSFLDKMSQRGDTSYSDQVSLALKESLHSHWLQYVPPSQLDVPNKEWFPGEDYFLIGDKPINYMSDGHRDGSCALVFQIKHKGQLQVLKMMINLINMETNRHGQGYSMEHFLDKNFGAEHQLPMAFNGHPNLIKVRHHFTGPTDRFQKYLGLLVPSKFDVPIEMASRTSFVVLDFYPESLKSFSVHFRTLNSQPPFGLDSMFILQLLYQILSAVYYIRRNGVIHRDIKADNVFLDAFLRPVLADFGMARKTGESESSVLFTDSRQVCAGNAHAWAPELTRWNRVGPPQLSEERVSLKEIYSKSDAYAVSRMFYSLLRPAVEGDTFPQSSRDHPHYENSEIPELPSMYPAGLKYILRNLVLNDPLDRMIDRKAMLYVGMLMFPPTQREITVETQTARYCQARMLKLLSLDNSKRCSSSSSPTQRLTMSESVQKLSPELEADFLYNITPEEFWEIYQDLKQRDFLPL